MSRCAGRWGGKEVIDRVHGVGGGWLLTSGLCLQHQDRCVPLAPVVGKEHDCSPEHRCGDEVEAGLGGSSRGARKMRRVGVGTVGRG